MGSKRGMADEKACNQRLEEILGCGRFQYWIIFTFMPLISVLGGFEVFQLVFTITDGQFRCALPPEVEQRLAFDSFLGHENLVGKCDIAAFDNSSVECLSKTTAGELVASNCFSQDEKSRCGSDNGGHGYVINTNYSGEFYSLVSEKQWFCDDSKFGANVYAAKTFGTVVWTLLLMQLIDKWGRIPILYLSITVTMVFRLIAFFITDHYLLMCISLAISAPFGQLGTKAGMTLVAEYCNAKGRTMSYYSLWVFWVLGVTALPLVAWLCQDWFTFGMVTTCTYALLFPFYWVMPESPRLLLTQGKVDKAESIIRKIKKINKEAVTDDLHEELCIMSKALSQSSDDKFIIQTIFKNKRLSFYLALLSISWIVNDIMYASGQLNSGHLAGNLYTNFALVALTELPACFIGQFMVDWIGRRWSHVACMFGTALAQVIITVVISLEGGVTTGAVTGLALAGRICSNVAWYVMWIQAMEILPTNVRGTGTNICGVITAVTALTVPYISMLGSESPQLMYGILALVSTLGMVATSLMPETYKQPLLECVEDMDHLQHHSFCSFRVWKLDQKSGKDGQDEEKEKFSVQPV